MKIEKEQRSCVTMVDLPDDVLIEILGWLPFHELHSICPHVCARFKTIVSTYTYSFKRLEVDLRFTELEKTTVFLTNHRPLIRTLIMQGINSDHLHVLATILDLASPTLQSLTLEGKLGDRLTPALHNRFQTSLLRLGPLTTLDLSTLETNEIIWCSSFMRSIFAKSPSLEVLRLRNVFCEVVKVVITEASRKLRVFDVQARIVTPTVIAGLKGWKYLSSYENLNCLTAIALTKDFWKNVAQLPSLRRLKLLEFSLYDLHEFNEYSDESFWLSVSSTLQSLALRTSEDISDLFRGRSSMWRYFSRVKSLYIHSRSPTIAPVIKFVHSQVSSLFPQLESLDYKFKAPEVRSSLPYKIDVPPSLDQNFHRPKRMGLLIYGLHAAIQREVADLKEIEDFANLQWTSRNPQGAPPALVGTTK